MSFSIYTMIPRQRISEQDSICYISTSVLVVEEDDSVLEPLSWLDVHTSEITVEVFKLCLDFALTFNPYFYTLTQRDQLEGTGSSASLEIPITPVVIPTPNVPLVVTSDCGIITEGIIQYNCTKLNTYFVFLVNHPILILLLHETAIISIISSHDVTLNSQLTIL